MHSLILTTTLLVLVSSSMDHAAAQKQHKGLRRMDRLHRLHVMEKRQVETYMHMNGREASRDATAQDGSVSTADAAQLTATDYLQTQIAAVVEGSSDSRAALTSTDQAADTAQFTLPAHGALPSPSPSPSPSAPSPSRAGLTKGAESSSSSNGGSRSAIRSEMGAGSSSSGTVSSSDLGTRSVSRGPLLSSTVALTDTGKPVVTTGLLTNTVASSSAATNGAGAPSSSSTSRQRLESSSSTLSSSTGSRPMNPKLAEPATVSDSGALTKGSNSLASGLMTTATTTTPSPTSSDNMDSVIISNGVELTGSPSINVVTESSVVVVVVNGVTTSSTRAIRSTNTHMVFVTAAPTDVPSTSSDVNGGLAAANAAGSTNGATSSSNLFRPMVLATVVGATLLLAFCA